MSPCEEVVQVSSVPRGAAAGSKWRFHHFLLQRWGIPLLLLKMAAAAHKLRIVGAAQVVAVCAKGETILAGSRMKDIVVYQASSLLTWGLCVCVCVCKGVTLRSWAQRRLMGGGP